MPIINGKTLYVPSLLNTILTIFMKQQNFNQNLSNINNFKPLTNDTSISTDSKSTQKTKTNNNQNNFTIFSNIDEIPNFDTLDTEKNALNKFIENAINLTYTIKLELLKEKQSSPEKFMNIQEILSSPGLLSNQNNLSKDHEYILCLLGRLLENYEITVGIYKENSFEDNVDSAAIQFIFSGLISKKKFELILNENDNVAVSVIYDLSYRKDFINDLKIGRASCRERV